ncbi:MAG: hypothetical protein OEZ47_03015 [Gammaproteobacteria bacterium]|nr:hypothetical protein [Gammaproteobacteria bacterium]
MKKFSGLTLTCLFMMLYGSASLSAEKSTQPEYEDEEVYARIVRRTPEQLRGFYLGREFSSAAVDKIVQSCLITPIIKNKKLEALWVDLDLWRFEGKERIQRLGREHWHKTWDELQLKQAHRSTFGWTLMPEVRDLRLDEGVGGSVVIPWQTGPFTLRMRFPTGLKREGPVKEIVFKDLTCVEDIKP